MQSLLPGVQLSVLPDRAQGAASLAPGHVEFMVSEVYVYVYVYVYISVY